MSHKSIYVLGTVIMLVSILLAACAPAVAPTAVVTEAPAPTEAPKATEAPKPTEVPPTEAPKPTEVPPTAAPAYDGMSQAAPDCNYGGEMKSIEATDELTVKFTLCSPDPAFPSKIAFSSFGIQPAEWIEQNKGGGSGSALLEHPVGTGPYVLKEWKRGDSLTMSAFPDYWGDKAKTPTLVFRWSAEAAQRKLELDSGNVDGIDNPGPDDFDAIQNNPDEQLIPRPALSTFYVGMNDTLKPFDNEQVRQAIAMGIDRKRIVDNFYPAGSEVADYFTPCAIPNGCVGDKWYDFDPVAAKKLLSDAGFPNGFDVELSYRDVVRGYLPQPGQVAQDIQAQLKKNLGINVKINVMESGAFLDAAAAGKLPFFMLGWGADYPDQTNFVNYHFGSGANDSFGTKFPDLVDALTKAAALATDDLRAPLYEQANNLIKQHVPMVPVAHGGSATAWKATVEGAHSSPLGNENLSVVSVPGQDTFVWMQNAEPISLYCADETDGELLRGCEQITESLLGYVTGGTAVEPKLATACTPNADLTEWTCTLREGVKFHDGSSLDANDVVESLVVQWDAKNPLHVGRTGVFNYWSGLFGPFLNAPPASQ